MLFNEKKLSFQIDGKECSFSMGKIARKSQVAIYATMGDTTVLTTINRAKPNPEFDYFPLSVEYIEKLYSAGIISSSRFVKRERFPADEAVLKARMIDRSIRSRFAKDFRDELQVIVKVLSYEESSDPVILAVNAISAGLMIMGVPFDGPVSLIRVALNSTESYFANYKDDFLSSPENKMNLVLAGDTKRVVNIDADMQEISEEKVVEAMKFGMQKIGEWMEKQNEFLNVVFEGKERKIIEYTKFVVNEELYQKMYTKHSEETKKLLKDVEGIGKDAYLEDLFKDSDYDGKYSKQDITTAFEKMCKKLTREILWTEEKRLDGRDFDEIREIEMETGLLPRSHGSGLFSRGMTQVMTVAVLDSLKNMQLVQDVGGEVSKRYLHYYEEAPYSYGIVDRLKFVPGRRAIGHGALAEKALIPVLPSEAEFPYMIMLISEIMSENGSSSMASICGSTLALLDAGVQLKKYVAGIALGLLIDEDEHGKLNMDNYKLLTDMRDVEDFYGFMDFKVGGTKDGITAIQMDEKAGGLTIEIIENAFKKSKEARVKIIEMMEKVIPKANKLSKYAPKFSSVRIPKDKIGELIGPGGKNIKELTERTGADINIDDDGTVSVYAVDEEKLKEVLEEVGGYGATAEIGKEYTGKVVRIEAYGAFVELGRGLTGLLHISELGNGEFVKDVNKVVKMGDVLKVVVSDIDRDNKIRLIKADKNIKKDR